MAAQARAAEPEATRLVFQSPAGCGSAEDFSARVQRRSVRIQLAQNATASRSLLVEIQAADAAGSWRGRVTLVDPSGSKSARQLKAATCEDVLEALALIATVTLDPEAMLGEPAHEEAPPKPEAQPEPKAEPVPPAVVQPRHPESYRISFGLGAEVLLRVAAEVVPGAQASAALELNPGAVLSPFWRLSLTHAQRRGLAAPGAGEANFAYTLPTLEVCPVRLGAAIFGFRPCGFGSVGVVKAWGSGPLENQSHTRLAGSAGLSLLGLLRLGKAVEIIADGRVGLPFKRDTFGFDGVASFRTPTPGFSAGLGVAGGFP